MRYCPRGADGIRHRNVRRETALLELFGNVAGQGSRSATERRSQGMSSRRWSRPVISRIAVQVRSCSAVIRNNTATGNGFGANGWVDGAGILVSTSPDVEVYGNVVRNNNDGIGGIHADRKNVNGPCKRELRNFWVHDNIIEMKVGHTGVVTNKDGAVFTNMNNRFDNNTYTLGSGKTYYRWADGPGLTSEEWKAYGQDPNGTWK